jgi:hypothetical protein
VRLSKTIRDAMAILGQEPLPPDAEARLAALEKRASKEERHLFADIWEGYFVASTKQQAH